MRARIKDVRAHAGVSSTTVFARGLAGNRSYLLALLYDNATAGSAYIMELIVGVLQACRETPYTAELYPLDDSDKVMKAIDGLLARSRPDGTDPCAAACEQCRPVATPSRSRRGRVRDSTAAPENA